MTNKAINIQRRMMTDLPVGYAAYQPKAALSLTAEAKIEAAEAGEDGKPKGPATFSVLAYTGKPMQLAGWDLPVLIDLEGMEFGNSLVANLDHDSSKRVGNAQHRIENNMLYMDGTASAATEARREVVESARDGFVWQASIEANANNAVEVAEGESVTANGGTYEGPLYHVTASTLKGFGFVSHGADDDTTVAIAATASTKTPKKKGKTMEDDLKAFITEFGFDPDELNETQMASMKASFEGTQKHHLPPKKLGEGAEEIAAEAQRQNDITEFAHEQMHGNPYNIEAIKKMAASAIRKKLSLNDFKLQLLEAQMMNGGTIRSSQADSGLTGRVLEAAVCQAGRLKDVEKFYDERTLEAAHSRFGGHIGLNQLIMIGAKENGYHAGYNDRVTVEAQQAAFGMPGASRAIHAAGFSTISITTILSNIANKFLRMGWDTVDQVCLRISSIRPVNDFKTITTTSLIGDNEFELVGRTGEIKHGRLGEVVYTNKADTYAKMLAITRQDYRDDNLGALTQAPRRLGRGAALALNRIFWTEFLDNAAFFTAANNNAVTAALSIDGLNTAETAFMNQTDLDGQPLGIMPEILLVPPQLKHTAKGLYESDKIQSGAPNGQPENNTFAGMFRPESSTYLANAQYTGSSPTAWYLLADPEVLPVIEIAALDGRVEPVVESADASFNVLGVELRGYSDVGVNKQEFRAGVRSN